MATGGKTISKVSAMDKLIKAIQFAIADRELNMSEAARIAGVSRAYLYRVLSGESVPSVEVAEQIADAFGLKFTVTQK